MDSESSQPRPEDLQALLDVTRQLGRTVELPELLRSIVQATTHVLRCERATVFLYDSGAHELYSIVAEGAEGIRFSADQGIAGQAIRTGDVINVPDAYADPRFNRDIDRQLGFRTRNLLALPLRDFEGRLVGVLQALNKRGADDGFTPSDEQLASALSAQAGVAVHRQTLLEEYAVKRKQDSDLALARTIQQGLLPEHDPTVAGFDVAGWNRPADETGGDWYDFVPLSDDRLCIMLADAVGHGIPAALIMAECRALLRALVSASLDLGTTLARVNTLLYADLVAEQFVTAFVGVLDPARSELVYVSAGQGPLLLYRAAERRTVEFPATTVPLAVLEDTPFDPGPPVKLAPGDVLVVVTDGFHEWRRPNPGGREEAVGIERINAVVCEHAHRSARELIGKLHDAVTDFVGPNAVQNDDLTAVVVKRNAAGA